MALILFEGGLTLRHDELPHIRGVLLRLISIGAVITWVVATLAARLILNLSWSVSILLGAILIVTGPTVIGPLLRQIKPQGQAGAVVKWEGILIDPVGAVLAVLVFEAMQAGDLSAAPGTILLGVLETAVIGLVTGLVAATLMIGLLRRYLIPDHLQNGVALVFIVVAFALSNLLHHESGLLTVTVMGLVVANQRLITIRHIVEFKENLQILLVGTLFILLAARMKPGSILALGWESVLFVAVLILIARPLSVLISTAGSSFSWKERLFVMWMAPRGIVAADGLRFLLWADRRGRGGAEAGVYHLPGHRWNGHLLRADGGTGGPAAGLPSGTRRASSSRAPIPYPGYSRVLATRASGAS